MAQIVLTQEQAQILREATEGVEVIDPEGNVLSFLTPMDPTEAAAVARFKSRRHLPCETTIPAVKVHAHLLRLEEIRQTEGMDEAKMIDLVRRMQAGEDVI